MAQNELRFVSAIAQWPKISRWETCGIVEENFALSLSIL